MGEAASSGFIPLVSKLLWMAGMVYVGLGLLLYVGQSAFIYHPTPDIELDDVRVMALSGSGGKLNVHVVNEGRQSAVLYFGGNAEAVIFNAPMFRQALHEHTVYFMNYRGYGGSEGRPGEQALYADALTLYDDIAAAHEQISAIGRSLGSGVATYLAAERALEKLVLVTPFDSLVNVAFGHYPVYPVSIMLRDKYDSIGRVDGIDEATLIMVAARDRIVPPSHANALASAFPAEQVTKHVISGVGHNTISGDPDYYRMIRDFL